MKKLNILIDFSFTDEKPEVKKVWENFIIAGCQSTYKDGLNLKMQTRVSKILDKIESSEEFVDFEDAEFEIIKEIQEKGKFPAHFCRVAAKINELIDEVK